LRQQTASAVSATSSASAGLADSSDPTSQRYSSPSRRHRSSSNLSARSGTTAATYATGATGTSGHTIGTTAGIAGSTVSGIAPPRDSSTSHAYFRDPLSRQSSVASRRSEASSPSLSSSLHQGDQFPNLYAHRHSGSLSQATTPAASQQTTNPGNARPSYIPTTSRYEEIVQTRAELDAVKRENEALRRRVRELERNLNSQRQSGADLGRSASVSTNASMRQRSGRGRADEEEEPVNVGESAGSIGVGGGH